MKAKIFFIGILAYANILLAGPQSINNLKENVKNFRKFEIRSKGRRPRLHLNLDQKKDALDVSFNKQVLTKTASKIKAPSFPKVKKVNFTSATLSNQPETFIPPDTTGAKGPKQFITVTNSGFRSFCDKVQPDGSLKPDNVLEVSLESFFNHTAGMSDPRIKYDKNSQRWFVTAIDTPPINNNIYIAVSDFNEKDPGVITTCTKWQVFKFQQNLIPDVNGQGGDNGAFLDFPTLGLTKDVLLMTGRMFGATTLVSSFFVFNKQSLIDGNPKAIAFRDQLDVDTVQGADDFDGSDAAYFIGASFTPIKGKSTTFNKLYIWKLSNVGTNPSLSAAMPVIVPDYSFANVVPFKGNLFGPAAGVDSDNVVTEQTGFQQSVHVRNKQMYASCSISVNVNSSGQAVAPTDGTNGDRNAARYYQIDLSEAVPKLVQIGTLYDKTPSRKTLAPNFFFYPSIMTNKHEDLVIGCSTCAANKFVSSAVTGITNKKRKNKNNINLNKALILSEGRDSYELLQLFAPPDNISNRWGDYSTTVIDVNDEDFWTTQEFVTKIDDFGIQVAKLGK